jgi:hypothetical protein
LLKTSPTSAAWDELFRKFPILQKTQEQGFFRLTADQIRKTGREPRLMTKFDSREHRPKVLANAGLTILPVSNGEYLLLNGDGYAAVPPSGTVHSHDASKIAALETIRWQDAIRGESQAIDTLFMASALRAFVADPELLLTMRGRLRSSRFTFHFQTNRRALNIPVQGVQIEVDAGFEGRKIVLVEAKFGAINNFMIRQLYYPYRNLLELGVRKQIVPVLLVYSNRVYSLYEFEFPQPNLYEIRLVRQASYTLDPTRPIPHFSDIKPKKIAGIPPSAPFPQADDLSKVFDVTDLLVAGAMRKEEIALDFDVDPRQGDYYGNAASWLGLAAKPDHQFILTEDGQRFARMDRIARIVEIASRLKALPAFSETAEALIKKAPLAHDEIANLISRKYHLGGTTPARRASTVRAWIDWLSQQLP